MIYGHARASIGGQTFDARLELLHAAPCGGMEREKVSGVKSDRLERLQMLDSLAAGDQVTLRRNCRLARTTLDAGAIVRRIVDAGTQFRSWAGTFTSTGGLIIAVRAGLAEFERGLIRARTSEGRERGKARGVRMGRRPKLTPHQIEEVKLCRDAGEPIRDIAKSYDVSYSTILRLVA